MSASHHVSAASDGTGYEYLDHTADVQMHGWGPTLEQAIAATCCSISGYITDAAAIQPTEHVQWEATGYDLYQLLYNVLDECVFRFATEKLLAAEVTIGNLQRGAVSQLNTADDSDGTSSEGDSQAASTNGDAAQQQPWSCTVSVQADRFDLSRHTQGTEIKAITYSAMQVKETLQRTDVYVIVDI